MKLLVSLIVIVCLGIKPGNPEPVAEQVCLSAEEKKLYDLIIAYRKSKRLPNIPLSAKLSRVAQAHVRDIEEHYSYDETGECNPHSWSANGSWSACCYADDHREARCMWDKPKEIAGYAGNGYEIAYFSSAGASAAEGLEGWKKSKGHNPLLVNSGIWKDVKWKAIGVGIFGNYGVVWFGEEADPDAAPRLCK